MYNPTPPPLSLVEPVMVVAPHLDDAALSCSAVLAAHPGTVAATVFAGAPRSPHEGYNSATTGRRYAPDAIAVRRREDSRALASVGAHPVWLDLLDLDYASFRPDRPYLHDVEDALRDLLARHRPATLVSPVGIWHPDHLLVASAALAESAGQGITRLLYADLPYARAVPDLLHDRLREISRRWDLTEVAIDAVARDKRALVHEYRSQVRATRQHQRRAFAATLRGAERYWLVSDR